MSQAGRIVIGEPASRSFRVDTPRGRPPGYGWAKILQQSSVRHESSDREDDWSAEPRAALENSAGSGRS